MRKFCFVPKRSDVKRISKYRKIPNFRKKDNAVLCEDRLAKTDALYAHLTHRRKHSSRSRTTLNDVGGAFSEWAVPQIL